MKARPMLMSAPMVRAILAGNKTQTRRVVKPQPQRVDGGVPFGDAPAWAHAEPGCAVMRCPYGKRGDRLWVRETYFAWGRWETRFSAKKGRDEWHFVDLTMEAGKSYLYAANGQQPQPMGGRRHKDGVTPTWWKRPAIFMPRCASRITLEVTGVRVERLQDISEADAAAEGIERTRRGDMWRTYRPDCVQHWNTDAELGHKLASSSYASLWESINGPESWDANPWVWVIDFKRLEVQQ